MDGVRGGQGWVEKGKGGHTMTFIMEPNNEVLLQSVTPISPGYEKGPLGLADIRSATRSTSGLTSGMGVVNLIF